jgi:hypothetical protein
MVTANLIAALLRFRHPTNQRNLWMDSVCINQNAIDERNQQVKLMGNIYQKASRVLVWLGEEDSNTELAYSCLRAFVALKRSTILEQSKNQRGRGAERTEPRWTENEICKSLKLPLPNSAGFQALQALLERQWFSRAWVYQESSLARECWIVTGSHEIQGSSLALLFEKMSTIQRHFGLLVYESLSWSVLTGYSMFGPWEKLTKLNDFSNFWATLHSLLVFRKGTQAHDPRDIVYSLIGVASRNSTLELDPDYKMPWEDMYTSTAKHIISNSGDLRLLCSSSRPGRYFPRLPTWVPDWRQSCSSIIISYLAPTLRKYYSSGSSQVVLRHNGNPNKLEVRGVRCDEIHHIFLSEESLDGLLRRSNIASSKIPDADQRNDFTTSECGFGFGPKDTKVGDCIFILLGAEVPILLRREGNGTEFSFVGECFVNNLMQGEGLLKARKKADPSYDLEDKAWLMRLHEEDVPFPMDYVVII